MQFWRIMFNPTCLKQPQLCYDMIPPKKYTQLLFLQDGGDKLRVRDRTSGGKRKQYSVPGNFSKQKLVFTVVQVQL